MATAKYLLQRPAGKGPWYVRFQYSVNAARILGVPRVMERSLRTRDARQAEINAAPDVLNHHYRMQHYEIATGVRPAIELIHRSMKPGSFRDSKTVSFYATPDGEKIIVSSKKDHKHFRLVRNKTTSGFLGAADGPGENSFVRAGELAPQFAPRYVTPGELGFEAKKSDESKKKPEPVKTPRMNVKTLNEVFITRWQTINHGSSIQEFKCRAALDDLLATTGKNLCEATVQDAEALYKFYETSKWKRSYWKKKFACLGTLVRSSMGTPHALEHNVFVGIIKKPKRRLQVARRGEAVTKSFSEYEVRLIIAYRDKMPRKFQTLVMLCLCTGMRPREAVMIDGESAVAGMRCVNVGTKDEDGKLARTIPLPPIVFPFLPVSIDGPLFPDCPQSTVVNDTEAFNRLNAYMSNLTQQMGRHLRKAGIVVTQEKRLYSARHRAIDKLTGARVLKEDRASIVGHEGAHSREKINSEGYYGDGPAMKKKARFMKAIWKGIEGLEQAQDARASATATITAARS